MFKKILIVYKVSRDKAHKEALRIVKQRLIHYTTKFVKIGKVKKMSVAHADLIMTLGGDGTFLYAAQFITDTKPLFGVHTEGKQSQGALLHCSLSQFSEQFTRIEQGDYVIKKLPRIAAVLNGKELPFAVNDVYIGSQVLYQASHYRICFSGNEEPQTSSGVLITTCTGSTAWYQSAGGKPFTAPDALRFLVREPYQGNHVKPKITHGIIKQHESFEITSSMYKGIIAFDSLQTFPFCQDIKTGTSSRLALSLSDTPLHVIVC